MHDFRQRDNRSLCKGGGGALSHTPAGAISRASFDVEESRLSSSILRKAIPVFVHHDRSLEVLCINVGDTRPSWSLM